jgi:hypothetical protein
MKPAPSMTVKEAARILRLSVSAVERLLDDGQLVRVDRPKQCSVLVDSVHALADVLLGERGISDLEQWRINAARACVKADVNEARVDMICEVLGLYPSEVPTDRGSVIRSLRAINAEVLVEGVCPSVDSICRWSRFVSNITSSYLALIEAYGENQRPWRPFVRFFEHVHETAPSVHQLSVGPPDILMAHSYANHARRHLNQVAYVYLAERDGAVSARAKVPVPEDLGDRMYQHMMGMRPDAVRTAFGPTSTEGVQRQRPTTRKRADAARTHVQQDAQDLLRDLDADEADDLGFLGIPSDA